VSFDLTSLRESVDHRPLHEVTAEAKDRGREYVRRRGFLRGGNLLALDDTYLAAVELTQVADVVGRSFTADEDEELYLLDLLRGADLGDRPVVERVPESMRAARGLAYANAIRDYLRELRDWIDDGDHADPRSREVLHRLDQHIRRVRALSGDVPARESERLVETIREVTIYLKKDDETALVTATTRLDGFDD
jgi:hypothetical protein